MVAATTALCMRKRLCVQTAAGTSEEFGTGVRVYQGSVPSQPQYITGMDEATRGAREGVPRDSVYADGLVLMAESEEEVVEAFVCWKEWKQEQGLKVNWKKQK